MDCELFEIFIYILVFKTKPKCQILYEHIIPLIIKWSHTSLNVSFAILQHFLHGHIVVFLSYKYIVENYMNSSTPYWYSFEVIHTIKYNKDILYIILYQRIKFKSIPHLQTYPTSFWVHLKMKSTQIIQLAHEDFSSQLHKIYNYLNKLKANVHLCLMLQIRKHASRVEDMLLPKIFKILSYSISFFKGKNS